MSNHTPTPWKTETHITDKNGEIGALYCDDSDERNVGRTFIPEDAAYIVKCVNEREDLVRFVEIVAAGYSLADKCNELTNCEHELWDIARALLDKVGSADLDQ